MQYDRNRRQHFVNLFRLTELNLVANKYGIRKVVDKKSVALILAVEELLSPAQPLEASAYEGVSSTGS